jgi:hypothetical protein
MGERFKLRDPSAGPGASGPPLTLRAMVVRPDVGDGQLWITWVVREWERESVAPLIDGRITALPSPDARWRITGKGVTLRVAVEDFERAMEPESHGGAAT